MSPFADLRHGDCREIIATLDDNSIDAIVTDPPYELGLMGKKWDNTGIAYDVHLWTQCLRVLKPGGHLLAFGGTRTYHRMACAIEDAGFEIRDSIHWLYGSGFPKSLDVSKAIDKQRHDRAEVYRVTAWIRAERDGAGITNRDIDNAFGFAGMAGHWTSAKSQPAVPTLEQVPTLLDVLGVALDDVPDEIRRLLWELNSRKGQPGENWARREVIGNSENGIAGGTGKHAGQADAYGYGPDFDITAPATDAARQWEGWGTALKPAHEPIVVARKPLVGTVAANVLQHGTGALNIDGCRVGVTDADYARNCSGDRGHDGTRKADQEGATNIHAGGGKASAGRWPANVITDGSIEAEWVRYFYCAKPSKAERNAGLDALPKQLAGTYDGNADTEGARKIGARPDLPVQQKQNTHPTVKPLALMRYLVRLVTPPGGTVLEPFAGSGTTLAAAILEGFDAIGCELTADYLPIIEGRIAWAQAERAKANDTLFGDAA